jgi:hypothetical protein
LSNVKLKETRGNWFSTTITFKPFLIQKLLVFNFTVGATQVLAEG